MRTLNALHAASDGAWGFSSEFSQNFPPSTSSTASPHHLTEAANAARKRVVASAFSLGHHLPLSSKASATFAGPTVLPHKKAPTTSFADPDDEDEHNVDNQLKSAKKESEKEKPEEKQVPLMEVEDCEKLILGSGTKGSKIWGIIGIQAYGRVGWQRHGGSLIFF